MISLNLFLALASIEKGQCPTSKKRWAYFQIRVVFRKECTRAWSSMRRPSLPSSRGLSTQDCVVFLKVKSQSTFRIQSPENLPESTNNSDAFSVTHVGGLVLSSWSVLPGPSGNTLPLDCVLSPCHWAVQHPQQACQAPQLSLVLS